MVPAWRDSVDPQGTVGSAYHFSPFAFVLGEEDCLECCDDNFRFWRPLA